MKTKRILSLVLIICLILSFAPIASARATIVTTATVSINSSGQLVKQFTVSYSTYQHTTYTVTLQQKVNNSWVDYGTPEVGYTPGYDVNYNTTCKPTKGYTYRLKVDAHSFDFGNVVFYSSNTVNY